MTKLTTNGKNKENDLKNTNNYQTKKLDEKRLTTKTSRLGYMMNCHKSVFLMSFFTPTK